MAPVVGWQVSSAAMVAGVAKWPVIVKVMAKMGLGFPFVFHSLNGVRHLVWDMVSSLLPFSLSKVSLPFHLSYITSSRSWAS